MKDLIEALQIFLKYDNPSYPTHCEHDILHISSSITSSDVTKEDIEKLEELGFLIDEEGYFYSYKFGSY
jgi:hypothetical protein